MVNNIFFDLDGTLLDSRWRLFNLFVELTSQNKFDFNNYWDLKRQRTTQADMLYNYFNYSDAEINKFKKAWLSKIEDKERLKQDVPFPKSKELLEILFKKYNLYIVTNRQQEYLAIEQIRLYGWLNYLTKVLVTKQEKSKLELVKEFVGVNKGDIFIGDTGEDILTGKLLGIRTVAVSSGFLNAEILSEYNPDILLHGIEDIYEDYNVLFSE
jgi:phosphoglycolate phosphatase